MASERRYDGVRVSAGHLDERCKPGMPFNEGHDVAVLRTRDQIALPVAGYGSVFDPGGPLADGDGTDYLAA